MRLKSGIGGRLYASFALIVLIVTAMSAFGFVAIRTMSGELRDALASSFKASNDLGTLRTRASELTLLLDASVKSADLSKLASLEKELVSVQPRMSAAVGAVAAEWVDAGRRYAAAADSADPLDTGAQGVKFAETAERLDAAIDSRLQRELTAMEAKLAMLERARGRVAWFFGVGMGICLAGALGLAIWLRRTIVTPLKELTAASNHIAQTGELSWNVQVRGSDEIGQLSASFARMVNQMRDMHSGLQGSGELLKKIAVELTASTQEQSEMISMQAATLQETQTIANQINESSQLAAQKAQSVLEVVQRAEDISRSGGAALEQSLSGLSAIQNQVHRIAQQIVALDQRTREVGGITDSVKELADQTNMLSLNASIQAARSGEAGKGFAVVAGEMRALADQSVAATKEVRGILRDITDAIKRSVELTEGGAREMEADLSRLRDSGENLRELSGIVEATSSAAREIAAEVSQQNAGINELFAAVSQLTVMMDVTVERLNTTNKSVATVSEVAENVYAVLRGQRA